MRRFMCSWISLADSAVMIGLRAWVKTDEYWNDEMADLLEQIKAEFDQAGIEIRTISLLSICPETEGVRRRGCEYGRSRHRRK